MSKLDAGRIPKINLSSHRIIIIQKSDAYSILLKSPMDTSSYGNA
jgi:hypothetical protein